MTLFVDLSRTSHDESHGIEGSKSVPISRVPKNTQFTPRAPFIPNKKHQIWRKKQVLDHISNDTHAQPINRLMITLPSHMLQNSIGNFLSNSLPFSTIKTWAHSSWSELRDIFYIDLESKNFVAIFYSKAARDLVHRKKGWFCCGSRLYTMIWIPNFKPQSFTIPFMPH